jgi:HD-GYP domain-containing protein (c-di-GMP phosphodiesterase class II)
MPNRTLPNDLSPVHFQFIETMAVVLDARDPYTAGHSERVGEYSHAIAVEMGLTIQQADHIQIAAKLHDVGKIGVPDSLLRKTGPLTPEEFGLVKLHPQIGRKILEKVARFEPLLAVVELHHENADGSGYPYKLRAEQIPLEASVVHVADAFDAMTSDRAYRGSLTLENAIEELLKNSGKQFLPQAVDAFLRSFRRGEFDVILAGSRLPFWMPAGASAEPQIPTLTGTLR